MGEGGFCGHTKGGMCMYVITGGIVRHMHARTHAQAVRNESKLAEVFGAQALEATSPSQAGQGLLDFVAGVDVTDAGTLKPELFAGADHVSLCGSVCVCGSVGLVGWV
jgi:hypothetical protein